MTDPRSDALADEQSAESFPASDPPAIGEPGRDPVPRTGATGPAPLHRAASADAPGVAVPDAAAPDAERTDGTGIDRTGTEEAGGES